MQKLSLVLPFELSVTGVFMTVAIAILNSAIDVDAALPGSWAKAQKARSDSTIAASNRTKISCTKRQSIKALIAWGGV